MVNAWSLAGSIMNGTFEEDYPLMDKEKYIYESPDGGKTVTRRKPFSDKREVIQGDYFEEIPWSNVEDKRDKDLDWIEKSGGFEWTPPIPTHTLSSLGKWIYGVINHVSTIQSSIPRQEVTYLALVWI